MLRVTSALVQQVLTLDQAQAGMYEVDMLLKQVHSTTYVKVYRAPGTGGLLLLVYLQIHER